jgi:hypothetical protein
MHEDESLIHLVRCAYRLQEPREIEVLDWDALCQLSDRHRVTPALAAVSGSSVPPAIRERVGRSLLGAGQQIIMVRRTLDQLANELSSRNAQALVFKGLALQDWVYGNQCRITGDIDLFVRTEEIAKVAEALRTLGFSPFPHVAAKTWRNATGIEIDLHTEMLEPYIGRALRFDEAWEQRMQLEKLPLPTLSPVDHMVFILIHGWKHQWCRLSWLVDSALIAQRLSAHEWSGVLDQARKQQMLRVVQLGLALCKHVLEPPGVVWEHVLDSSCKKIDPLRHTYRQRLFQPIPDSLSAKIANAALHIRGLEGLGQRSRYVVGRVGNFCLRRRCW